MAIEGVLIPKDTTVDFVPDVISKNPLIWGEDADKFDPARWDRLKEDQLSPYASATFSNGPRICIGKMFALLEVKIVLIELIRNYRFLSVEGPFTVENPSLTLRPCGLKIRLEKIVR